jgi:lipid-A-disaccharide synthase
MPVPNVLVSVGELSGDLYARRMIEALRRRWGEAVHFWGMGGPETAAAGVEVVVPMTDLQVHGVVEVLPNLVRLFRAFRRLVEEAERRRPAWAFLVDFQDFHLRLARELKRRGIRVIQMVGPTVWAWRPGRVRALREAVDKLLVIFPFEETIFREAGIDADYIGHPLLDLVRVSLGRDAFMAQQGWTPDAKVVGLLPGSRPSEVRRLLPILLEAVRTLSTDRRIQPFLVRAATIPEATVRSMAARYGMPDLPTVSGPARYDWMANADLLIGAAGTVTMEALLVRTPMIVVYKLHPLNWWIARRLVRIRYASMVNILAGEMVVPELLQDACTPTAIARLARDLLDRPDRRRRIIERYLEVIDGLGCLHAFEEGPRVIEEAVRRWMEDSAIRQ